MRPSWRWISRTRTSPSTILVAACCTLFVRGVLPRVTEEEIEAIEHTPHLDDRLKAKSVTMTTVDQRTDCLKAVTRFMLPAANAPEIKGTIVTFQSMAELRRDHPRTRKVVDHVAIAMA
jgi:hypothetical protein